MTPRPEKPTQPKTERLRPAGGSADGSCGTKRDGRQAVLSALRSEPHPHGHARQDGEDPTPDRPGIRIYAPPVYRHHYDGARWSTRHGDTPTAAYACTCGQTGTARGRDAVAALVADYAAHKHSCTGTSAPHTERRNAA
ncbi:hypothetical protein [Streptomyces durhamensis]|uniref:hypothetical protein n=1 Tax=Streptomyces durhamensis TaxID=68194 RepID=UPI001FD7AF36|nr:hypothetical protein [Streptomyces durhamensis]